MKFRAEHRSASGEKGAQDEGVFDQGAPVSEPGEPAAPVEEPSTPGEDPSPPAEEPSEPVAQPAEATRAGNMLPGRERRTLGIERVLMRVIATAGIVGIGVAIAAIMASSNVQGWIIGLVVSIVSVVLSALLWSSRQL